MQKFRTLFEKIGKNRNISHLIFSSYKNFPFANFDTILLPVRSVDGESLSEIAIHNFEKNRKIENRILPYGSQY